MITGDQVKKARIGLRESQARFAERFSVNQATVHRWEIKGVPEHGTAQKLIQRVLQEIDGPKNGAAA